MNTITSQIRKVGLLLFALFFSRLVLAQTEGGTPQTTTADILHLQNYASNIAQFNRHYPQEKVYLHMDNRSYFIGDTIWFKAYVMNASTLHPTQVSGVLYVELLNDFGAEIDRKKLEIKNGMCNGEFVLNDNYRTGFYEIRAYTRNMLNFGENNSLLLNYGRPWVYVEPSEAIALSSEEIGTYAASAPTPSNVFLPVVYDDDSLNVERRQGYRRNLRNDKNEFTFNRINEYVFSRVFPVYMKPSSSGIYERTMVEYPLHPGLAKPKEITPLDRPDRLFVSFYPEGGMLIDGVEAVVAFEVNDQWHRKQNIIGHIEDKDGYVITRIVSTSRGRGTFVIRPNRENPYIACITYKGKVYKIPLPYIERQGYAITLIPPIDADSDVSVMIKSSPSNVMEQIGWTLQCRGALMAHGVLSVAPGLQENIQIPSARLGSGVNQFTLYNVRGEILADRLFWVTPKDDKVKAVSINAPDSLSPYERVLLNIQVEDKKQQHQESFLSISITDADDYADSYDTGNIWSELLLSSELKGFIEDVDSYFLHASKQEMTADLDLLMLVQGWRWRRYEWHTMAGTEPFVLQYSPEKKLAIDGYVIGENYDSAAKTHLTNAYPRISNLAIEISLGEDNVVFGKTLLCDSEARFSLEIDKPLYGRIPLKMKLRDISGVTENRLWNSQIVINRSFSPQPQRYSYYETAISVLPVGTDTSCISLPNRVVLPSRSEKGIYNDRPELVVDYEKEWNWIIDRGIPCQNYLLNDDTTTMHRHYYFNFPYLSYSLTRMQSEMVACVKADSVFTKYRGAYHVPYVMPKRIKVYSNLLSRALDYNAMTPTSLPINYLIVEHYRAEDSPEYPPYLPKNGVRDTYFEGYSSSCEFYSPDYSECVLPDTPDYRRTLYWNPDITTSVTGKAQVTFYNNSQTKHLHIRAEGFTRNGEFIVYDSDKVR